MTEDFITADVVQLNDKQLMMKYKACLYRKLQHARRDFKDKNIRKRGRNNFNNFDYITLEDIVKEAIPILLDNQLSIHHKFYMSPPLIEVVDLETGYSEDFGSSADIMLEGKNHNQKLQALGSMESYLRRYIYMQILDIVEGDPDASFGREDKASTAKPKVKPQGRYTQKNTVDEARIHDLARQIGEELGERGVENVTNRNKLELCGEWFTEGRLTKDEFRAMKKHLGAVNI